MEEIKSTFNRWYDAFTINSTGFAKFVDPAGIASGQCSIHLSDNGTLSASMIVEDIDIEGNSDPVDPIDFFDVFHQKKRRRFDLQGNKCISLKTSNDLVAFEADGDEKNFLLTSISFKSTGEGSVFTIFFHIMAASVKAIKAKHPSSTSFIAMPLYGYQGPFHESAQAMIDHPLCFHKRPLMSMATNDENGKETSRIDKYQNITIFEINGEKGFIQPWGIAKDDSPSDDITPSAMLVIDAKCEIDSIDDVFSRIPKSIFLTLSLAAGSTVATPVFFTFNDQCQINKAYIIQSIIRKNDVLLNPFNFACENYCGQLLSSIYKSKYLNNNNICIALGALSKSGRKDISIEDALYFASRAIEALGNEFIKPKDLKSDLSKNKTETLNALIEKMNSEAREMEIDDEIKNRVFKQINSIFVIYPSLPDKISALLKLFGFPDEQILKNNKNWKRDIAKMRGIAVHGSSISFDGLDPFQSIRILNHMQDIALRVFFKTIEYPGKYSHPMAIYACAVTADRLSSDSLPRLLGYDD